MNINLLNKNLSSPLYAKSKKYICPLLYCSLVMSGSPYYKNIIKKVHEQSNDIEKIEKRILLLKKKLKSSIKESKSISSIAQHFPLILKEKTEEMEEYFINRIEFLTENVASNFTKKEKLILAKYIDVLEKNNKLKERITELEIKNRFYKERAAKYAIIESEEKKENIEE